MDIVKQTFLSTHSGCCVSLFMLTHRAGRNTEQGPIRFKTLLREVEEHSWRRMPLLPHIGFKLTKQFFHLPRKVVLNDISTGEGTVRRDCMPQKAEVIH